MLARKQEVFERDYQDNKEEVNRRQVGKNKKPKKNINFKNIILGFLFVGFFLAASLLHRDSLIAQKKIEILDIENEILELEQEKEYVLVSLEEIKSTSNIEERAVLELGMDYPSKEQISYIEVKDKTSMIAENKVESPLELIMNFLSSLF